MNSSPYREALAWLFGTQRFGIKLGLENIHRLLAALDLPRPNERVIHVAGTNGKGSVCALLDSVSRAGGYRTGLFTSPHLVTFRERIQVDGEMVSESDAALGLTTIRQLVAAWDPHPTFFEIVTALALAHFRKTKTEIVILETGMGGRLDATNAVPSVVSVLTPIDLDHQKWLGKTLPEIAREKAGIIKPGVPVVSARQLPEAEAVIRARAAEVGAPLDFVRQPFTRLPIALAGTHQQENASLALSALHTARIEVRDDAIAEGLATVVWPARFQHWEERTIIDGAHNPAGAGILARTWQDTFGNQKATVLLAVLHEKDAAAICAELGPIARRWLLPAIRSARALAPEELRRTIQEQFPDVPVATQPSFADAWEEAQRDSAPILITGSLHFAGEALAHLRGEPAAFEECLQ
ncbi:MAG: bifunctional folylpolyglutamate synthase/dihydrofolate synthase [Verrucomicrobiota bacterium]|nr:bifunctional folylpolyglutamate synthase/dihydrofolate synthase [Verrucomicrobiota bacterium]